MLLLCRPSEGRINRLIPAVVSNAKIRETVSHLSRHE